MILMLPESPLELNPRQSYAGQRTDTSLRVRGLGKCKNNPCVILIAQYTR